MNPGKLVVTAVWLLFAGSFFIATGSTAAGIGRIGFWAMAAAHAVECVAFLPSLRKADGSLAGHLVQTFLFGFLHLREVRAEAA